MNDLSRYSEEQIAAIEAAGRKYMSWQDGSALEALQQELDVEREKAARLERERDALAAQLAALRAEVHDVLAEPHAYIGGRERSVLTCAVAAAASPAVEAHARRVQAEALESAAEAFSLARREHRDIQHADSWLRARAAEIRGGR